MNPDTLLSITRGTGACWSHFTLFILFFFFEIDRGRVLKGERKALQIHSYSLVQYK